MGAVQQALASYPGVVGTVYATWNPSDKGTNVALSGGNLIALNNGGSNELVRSTLSKSSGKWYWEITVTTVREDLGVANSTESVTTFCGASANSLGYNSNGIIFKNSVSLSAVASYTGGDVIGIAFDASTPSVAFYKNNTLQYTATGANVPTGVLFACGGGTGGLSSSMTANFGATSLVYSPPAGYNAGLYV